MIKNLSFHESSLDYFMGDFSQQTDSKDGSGRLRQIVDVEFDNHKI